MKLPLVRDSHREVLKYLAYFILILGAALRIVIYFQNRNLFHDEANVARNIFERGYLQLLLPLSYDQYAPPLYLWTLKLLTSFLGYSEYVFKLPSLISGIVALYFLYILLQKYKVRTALWYPLFLFATGMIYIRYATELKQYSSDTIIALFLIWLALTVDAISTKPLRFFLIWACAGSLAIWSSMTSVFILSGIGLYYLVIIYCAGEKKKAVLIVSVAAMWLIQFFLYYTTVLKTQIEGNYLQNFHRSSFLILLPQSMNDFRQNWDVLSNILGVAAGHWALSIVFHSTLISLAMIYAFRQRSPASLLLLVPILLLIVAAALHQYALASRLVLFVMPLILILIGIGFETILQYKYINAIFLLISFICAFNFCELKYFRQPLQLLQITGSMDFLIHEKITGQQLYVHSLAYPAYFYYTDINPKMPHWKSLKNAKKLSVNIDYDSLSQTMKGKAAMLYGYIEEPELAHQQSLINQHLTTTNHYKTVLSQAYIYSSIK